MEVSTWPPHPVSAHRLTPGRLTGTTYTPEELFASTAPYYARYRPGYDPAVYDLLAERFELDGSETVRDLGTGTGVIALPLAGLVGTDRDQLLRDLDALILPGGAVVLASGGTPGDVNPAPWLQVITEVRTRYLGPERRAGSGTYTHPKERHQEVLARSPFSRVDTTCWDRTLVRTTDDVIGWVFSLSYSSSAQLGEDKDAFERDLREALLTFQPEGRFEETIRTEAIIASRP